MDRSDEDVLVLIVGGSLVGLSAALFLRQHWSTCWRLERHAGTAINAGPAISTSARWRSCARPGRDAVRRKSEEQYPPDGGSTTSSPWPAVRTRITSRT